MEYKGYEITISEPKSYHYEYYVLKNEKEIAYEGYFNCFTSAMDAAKKIVDDLTKEKYTPNNRPPYPWISVEDELPENHSIVLAIWHCCKENRVVTQTQYFSYTGIEYWIDTEDIYAAGTNYYVTHWQYLPALPE